MSEAETIDTALEQLRQIRLDVPKLLHGTPVAAERLASLLDESDRVLVEAAQTAADRRYMHQMVGIVDELEQRVFTLESAGR